MQIKDNTAATNQLSVSGTVGRAATAGSGSSPASEQPEGVQQQSSLPDGTIVSLLQQNGVLVIFSIDKETNEFVVKMINPSSNEVVKEIPPQDVPALLSSIQQVGSMLIDQHA
jgi:uncharacterized FlaG/YvyC family protein